MPTYASKTSVSSENTRNDIEKTLRRFGAGDFAYASTRDAAMIAFTASDRQVRFVLRLPDRDSTEFTHTPSTRQRRSADAAEREYEQAIRQRWRALLLLVKAKLEAVEAGIVTFESEFLAHVVLPDGSTVGEQVAPRIEAAYTEGRVRPLLELT